MIHPHDAFAALSAMVSPWWFVHSALYTLPAEPLMQQNEFLLRDQNAILKLLNVFFHN
jgi:hypothetical protein